MLLLLWTAWLSLLLQGCLGHAGDAGRGCETWDTEAGNTGSVCCEACKPGNRVVKRCGPDPEKLCTPCEVNTTTDVRTAKYCKRCTQCVGALVQVKACTSSTDTVCGCKPGLRCGDDPCSFCVEECNVGEEPTEDRSCRKCPEGTFNDGVHQPCKPLIVMRTTRDNKPTTTTTTDDNAWLGMVLWVAVVGMVLIIISATIVVIAINILWKGKKIKVVPNKSPIISTPTDDPGTDPVASDLYFSSPSDNDPRTLIAVECSYHEAQQEQGCSSASVTSEDSKDQLIV